MATTLLNADLPTLALRHRGKVRDVFDLGDDTLLMVATDRLSAFDVVLPDLNGCDLQALVADRADMPQADATRWVQPSARARVIALLLSDIASPITGALIPVKG